MRKDDDTPHTAPLAPWGTAERSGQNPFPVSPEEQKQHRAFWESKEAPATARAREIANAIAKQPVQGKNKGWGD